MKKVVLFSLAFIYLLVSKPIFAQEISDEAQRHFNQGLAAAEKAKSINDYKEAINEFEQAKKLAPNWPDVYYNLGLLYERIQDYRKTLHNLKMYETFIGIPLFSGPVTGNLPDEIKTIKEFAMRVNSINMMANSYLIWVKITDDFTPLKKEEFRLSDSGLEVEVVDYTRLNSWAKRLVPPPIPGTFVPVRVAGNQFYYEYIAHDHTSVGTPLHCPAQIKRTVEGEIISYDPVRVKIKRKETLLETVKCGTLVIVSEPYEGVFELMWPDEYKSQEETLQISDKLADHTWYRVDNSGILPKHKLKFRKNGSQLEFFDGGVKGTEKYQVKWSNVLIEGEYFEFRYVIDNCAHNELSDRYYQCTGVVINSRGKIVSENPLRIKVKTELRGYPSDLMDKTIITVEDHIYEAR